MAPLRAKCLPEMLGQERQELARQTDSGSAETTAIAELLTTPGFCVGATAVVVALVAECMARFPRGALDIAQPAHRRRAVTPDDGRRTLG